MQVSNSWSIASQPLWTQSAHQLSFSHPVNRTLVRASAPHIATVAECWSSQSPRWQSTLQPCWSDGRSLLPVGNRWQSLPKSKENLFLPGITRRMQTLLQLGRPGCRCGKLSTYWLSLRWHGLPFANQRAQTVASKSSLLSKRLWL